LGKVLLWSAATACAGIFITQAAEVHPAAFTLKDVMQAPFAVLDGIPPGAYRRLTGNCHFARNVAF
jgi:hypothetical protein